jgi:hypothetical protein
LRHLTLICENMDSADNLADLMMEKIPLFSIILVKDHEDPSFSHKWVCSNAPKKIRKHPLKIYRWATERDRGVWGS